MRRVAAVLFAALVCSGAVASGSASTAGHWVMADVAAQAKQQFPGYTGIALLGTTADDRVVWTAHAAGGSQWNLEVFQWRNGAIADLGPLPEGMTPKAFNSRGDIAGADYFAPSFPGGPPPGYRPPPVHAYLWKGGEVTSLGTLGEVGGVVGMNDRDQIVEFGEVKGTKWPPRTLLWQLGKARVLRSFAGDDTEPAAVNDRGDVIGSAVPANQQEYAEGFVWRAGAITRIGSPGTSYEPVAVNDDDLVVGISQKRAWQGVAHAFVWQGGKLTDLGPTADGFPMAVDDRGQVVEARSSNQQTARAILWQNGRSADLGSLGGPRTYPLAIDARGDVAGIGTLRDSTDENQDLRAFVWRSGRLTELPGRVYDPAGPMAIDDSGTLVAAGTGRDECTSNSDCSGQLLLWMYER